MHTFLITYFFSSAEKLARNPSSSRDKPFTGKIRCSGTLPCSTCSRRKMTCTFVGRYDRGRPPTPQSPAHNRLGVNAGNASGDKGNSGAARAQSVVSSPDASPPSREGNGVSPTADAPSSLTIEGQYVGTTSNLTFLQRAWSKLSTQNSELAPVRSDGLDSHQPLPSAGDILFHTRCSTPNVFPDDDRARHLLASYTDVCVVTHRIRHRQTFEAWLDTALNDRAQGHPISLSVGNVKMAIILALFAISTFRSHKIKTGASPDFELTGLAGSGPTFFAVAELTDSEVGFPVLESAQARLIQVLYLLQTTRMNKAWYTFGNTQSTLKPNVSFLVHSDYITQQCSKRVFWTAYIIYNYLSVVFGRPRMLHDDEVDQEFPDAINDEDMDHRGLSMLELEEESYISSLVFHARVAKIIGQIFSEVYHVVESQAAGRLSAANRLLQELRAWHGSLPAYLGAVKPTTLIASFRREASALQIAYLHALIHATRPFLLRDDGTNNPASELEEIKAECLSAARKTLELISNMAADRQLIYSHCWMQYVLLCALAVVYTWEIQQYLTNDTHLNSETQLSLHSLAERCRANLFQGSTAAPLGPRYGIILKELRLEAEKRASKRGDLFMNPAGHQGVPDTVTEIVDPADWLDLDSSVFYPWVDVVGPL
ncbi:hypothetical protein BDV06DRAFT_213694 [Aspergillus oleicola]